jgi:hypothetical protein
MDGPASCEIELDLDDPLDLCHIRRGKPTDPIVQAEFTHRRQLVGHRFLVLSIERDQGFTWVEAINVRREWNDLDPIQMFI